MAMGNLCLSDGCGKSAIARGMCRFHYDQWKRPRNTEASPSNGDKIRFLWDAVLTYEGDECLKWPYGRDGKGYGRLSIDGKNIIVSRMVCREVLGEPPTPKHEAAHSCGNGHLACVAKRHLSWKTPAENRADAIAHGTHVRGRAHKLAKLDEAQVRQIRAEVCRGMSQYALASQFNVSRGTISDIISGRHWAWLDAA